MMQKYKCSSSSYESLSAALSEGKRVERCTIDQNGNAVEWHTVALIDEGWDADRYRIAD